MAALGLRWPAALLLMLMCVAAARGAADAGSPLPANAPVDLAPPVQRTEAARPAPPPAVAAARDSENTPLRLRSGDAASAATQPAGAANKPVGLDMSRVLVSLAIVLGLIFVLKWVVSRTMGVTPVLRPNGAVSVLSRTALSPKQQLVLIRVGQRLVLIADSGTQSTTLCEITDPDEVAALASQMQPAAVGRNKPSPFGELFGRFRRGFDSDGGGNGDDSWDDAPTAPAADGLSASDNRAMAQARSEVQGLMDKVRSVTRQFRNA